ncbi:hypothetical protein GTZ78_08350, partial [Streptomyces sp. SID8361]|uniref:hypothetical protein n=1 Tax=Streptomyces sp. MnatMP-M27 TaxID=1839768 RepID=UPI00081DBEA3
PAAATVAALACAALLPRHSRPCLTVITTTVCTAVLGAMGPTFGRAGAGNAVLEHSPRLCTSDP